MVQLCCSFGPFGTPLHGVQFVRFLSLPANRRQHMCGKKKDAAMLNGCVISLHRKEVTHLFFLDWNPATWAVCEFCVVHLRRRRCIAWSISPVTVELLLDLSQLGDPKIHDK